MSTVLLLFLFFQTTTTSSDVNNDTTDGNTNSVNNTNNSDAIVNTPKKNQQQQRPTPMEQEKNKTNSNNTTITTPPNARIPMTTGSQNPMTPSARISALNIVSDLLRKVGVCVFFVFFFILFLFLHQNSYWRILDFTKKSFSMVIRPGVSYFFVKEVWNNEKIRWIYPKISLMKLNSTMILFI